MSILVAILLAFVFAIPMAWSYGKYLTNFNKGNSVRAGIWDAVIILIASAITLTLWDTTGNNPFVLVAYALGSGVGTYLISKHVKKQHV